MSRTSEHEIGLAVMRIAEAQHNGIATHARVRKQLPDLVNLSTDDWAESPTRPGEPMWHQIVRNIRSHHTTEGNFIETGYLEHIPRVGYRITEAGRRYLAGRGLS